MVSLTCSILAALHEILFVALILLFFMMIKLIVWNCQGTRKKMFLAMVKNLVNLHHPCFFIMVESRINGRKVRKVIKKLEFSKSHRMEAVGFSGGIWIMWKKELLTVDILVNRKQFIHLKISRGQEFFLFTVVYACPKKLKRKVLWKDLYYLSLNINEP